MKYARRAASGVVFPVSELDKAFLSSGDLIADRRASYAQMLAESGEPAAAGDLMAQALEIRPDWAAGWDILGGFQEKAGNLPSAIAAWRRVIELDPEDRFGARLKLAAKGAAPATAGTAVAYVETLFDHYASGFEAALLQTLNYVVPQELGNLIAEAAAGSGVTQFAEAADLGAGTGLMGGRLREMVSHLSGVDLSAAMLAVAERKGVYDRLEKSELRAWLAERHSAFDLITAADVLMYCGELGPIFAAAHSALRAGGFFAFSVEAHRGEGDLFLRPSLRYAHLPEAVFRQLKQADFVVMLSRETAIRRDGGEDQTGLLLVAQKPSVGAVHPVQQADLENGPWGGRQTLEFPYTKI